MHARHFQNDLADSEIGRRPFMTITPSANIREEEVGMLREVPLSSTCDGARTIRPTNQQRLHASAFAVTTLLKSRSK